MTQGEAYALKHALEDVEFRSGFKAFCDEQANDAGGECYKAMQLVPPLIERAIGSAWQARAYEEMFNKLEEFTRQQLSQ